MAGEYRKNQPPAPADFAYIDDVEVSHHCRANTYNPDAKQYDGPRCRQRIKPGEVVCHIHGGSAPAVRTAAQIRKAEIMNRHNLKKRAERDGIARIEDVYEELEANAAEAKAFKQICFEQVKRLEGEIRYKSTAGEQLRAEVALYERAMERANKFLIDYVKLGIADRRVKVAEAQALILVGVIQNILDRLDLSRDQKRIAATVVPDEFRKASLEPERE